jgi:hypothetical protein
MDGRVTLASEQLALEVISQDADCRRIREQDDPGVVDRVDRIDHNAGEASTSVLSIHGTSV